MLEIREFEDMVEDTLQRIIDDGVGITNISIGSVTRSIVESILSEVDIVQFTVYEAYLSKTIDGAEGEDLEDVVSILSVVRRQATYCTGEVTFSVTEISDVDIDIPDGSIISTPQTNNGTMYEFQTIGDCILRAGDESVTVPVISTEPGNIYIAPNNVTIINDSIIGIAEVTNESIISGGRSTETDDELRDRAKSALLRFGKGTCDAIRSAVMDIDEVIDVSVYDMASGVGTVDVLVVCQTMPPSQSMMNKIEKAIDESKAGGIVVNLNLPIIRHIGLNVVIHSELEYDNTKVFDSIYEYMDTLGIGDTFMISQCSKRILDVLDDNNADVEFTGDVISNVVVRPDEIIKPGSIIIDGNTFLYDSIEVPVKSNNILTIPKSNPSYHPVDTCIRNISSVLQPYDLTKFKSIIIKGTATYNNNAIRNLNYACIKVGEWENVIKEFFSVVGIKQSDASQYANSIVSGLSIDISNNLIEAINNNKLNVILQNSISTSEGQMKVVISSIVLVK